jgi:hypothetical protein
MKKSTPSPFYIEPPQDLNSSLLSPNYERYVVKTVQPLVSKTNLPTDLKPEDLPSELKPENVIYLSKSFFKNSQLPPEDPEKSVTERLGTVVAGTGISGSVLTVGFYPGSLGGEDHIYQFITERFPDLISPDLARNFAHISASISNNQVVQAIVIGISGGIISIAVIEAINPRIAPQKAISISLAIAFSISVIALLVIQSGVLNQKPLPVNQNTPGKTNP